SGSYPGALALLGLAPEEASDRQGLNGISAAEARALLKAARRRVAAGVAPGAAAGSNGRPARAPLRPPAVAPGGRGQAGAGMPESTKRVGPRAAEGLELYRVLYWKE